MAHEEELRKAERRHAIKALNDAEALPNPHIKHLFTDVWIRPLDGVGRFSRSSVLRGRGLGASGVFESAPAALGLGQATMVAR